MASAKRIGSTVRRILAPSAMPVKRLNVAAVVKKLAGRSHLHRCLGCARGYEDFCEEPAVNGRCRPCRGLVRPAWDAYRDPHDCCVGNCVQVVNPDKFLVHHLAGPGPWWQCTSCARCHPHPVLENP